MPAGVGQRAFPERVEIARLLAFGFVLAEFVEWFVEQGHIEASSLATTLLNSATGFSFDRRWPSR